MDPIRVRLRLGDAEDRAHTDPAFLDALVVPARLTVRFVERPEPLQKALPDV